MMLSCIFASFYPRVTEKCITDVNPHSLYFVGVLYFAFFNYFGNRILID